MRKLIFLILTLSLLTISYAKENVSVTKLVKKEFDNPQKYYVDMSKKKKKKKRKTYKKVTKKKKYRKKTTSKSKSKYKKKKKKKVLSIAEVEKKLAKKKKVKKKPKSKPKPKKEPKKEKKITSLSDDPLFHAKRETGLSLHDAINRAIELSPKIKAANEVVIQDKMKVDEAFAGHLPVVNLSGDTGYEKRTMKADDTQEDKAPALTSIYKYKKVDLYMTITENLWSGGSIEDAVNEKEAALKASLYDYRDKLESLVVETAKAYFKVVYAEIALKISNKNMKSYEKILKIVKIKEKNGAATKGDVNFIKANVENARTELVQKQKDLSDALAKYTYLLQITNNQDLPYEVDSPIYVADLEKSLLDANLYNAKLLKQKAYIKSTRYGFLASRGQFHPKIDLSVNGETRNEFDEGLGKRDKVTALITFNYNLYNGGSDEARAIRLLSKMKEQQYLKQDLDRQLTFDVKTLNQSVTSLRESLKLTEKEVLSAREVVKSYWISFQHGTQDLQALQLAQLNLNRAEQNYATYKRDLILNNYDLMQKTGVLLKFLNIKFKKDEDEFVEDDALLFNYYNLDDWRFER